MNLTKINYSKILENENHYSAPCITLKLMRNLSDFGESICLPHKKWSAIKFRLKKKKWKTRKERKNKPSRKMKVKGKEQVITV